MHDEGSEKTEPVDTIPVVYTHPVWDLTSSLAMTMTEKELG